MKVLMISRATLYSSPGGDTIQIESTAKYLRKLGVEVDIRLAHDVSIDYQAYDLLHLFNLIRPNDFVYHVKQSGKPFVLSTVYVDYSEYEKKNRQGFFGLMAKVLGKHKTEYVKVLARAILNGEKIVSPHYLFWGHKRSMKWLVKQASYLLPNSFSEMARVDRDLQVKKPFAVIPNAIDKEKFWSEKDPSKREGVICVARIEGLKNQLNLIRAMQGLDISLCLIGKVSPNHQSYYEQCIQAAGANVTFLDHISQQELKEIYRKAKVHVLPSWFETTGLSSLEAAFLGCNIVVTRKGDTEEYFGNYAFYCEPDDIDSIKKAVVRAYDLPYPAEFRDRIEKNYVWEVTAQKTLEAYKQVI
ncbi:glycosyltransferase family 4 protein [Paraflavisolibacter sp. H34]|uniref:glycosyltransferase family 4 protein n=1 Tax=Huijunlia imazamoxiresistens TaxID=3127457 RepID=UPI00301B557A